ncbi:MAG: class I SAM-dependent methyltransferase [Candidatus Hydrogenedentes bacterium]|nr:class I SAM-dependent methyltransferase [Candidatus Hydrogenedentota bacterium]
MTTWFRARDLSGLELAERGLIPERLIRMGIRRLLRQRLRTLPAGHGSAAEATDRFIASLRDNPIALLPESANQQHHEVPAAFYELVLGPCLKYSCCTFDTMTERLAEAEVCALAQVVERAQIEDGMSVLELGCGWGSFSAYLAQHLPNCRVTAVSNSHSQGEFVRRRLAAAGVAEPDVVTADMNTFEAGKHYDRIVSIEMFERMRNWGLLFERMSRWVKPEGRIFLHFFCNNEHAYAFEDQGSAGWMARNFFGGGMMPSFDLPRRFDDRLEVDAFWKVDGVHYERTSELWLANLYGARKAVLALFEEVYGQGQGERWFQRWRLFFLACAELFGHNRGDTWFVAHYRLRPKV